MSFFSKATLFVSLLIGACLSIVSPVLAAGTCTVTCTGPGTATATPVTARAVDTEAACTGLCPASCASIAGSACAGVFTPTAATPAPDAPRFVCACGCVNPGGGASVTISSTQSCARALASDPTCTSACTALCRAGTTAPDTRVRANATLAPTNGAGCAVAAASSAPSGDTPAAGGTTGGSSGGVPPTNANRSAVPLQLSQPIDGVTVVSDFGNYIAVLYRYVIGLAGTAAVVMIVYGGFLYLLGSATSDVQTGQRIIQDAIIGLLLVLGSYTILSTVNPNTLSLRVPELKTIVPVPLPERQAAPPPPTTNVCGDPGRDSSFRRPSAQTIQHAAGEPCSYDSECASHKCFMHNQTQGKCSDLAEGQRCKCLGSCCDSMTNSNQANTYLSDTNNGGVGNALCADGLVCQFRDSDWKCTRLSYAAGGGSVQTGSPVRPQASRPTCRLDSECVTALGTGAACLYNSRQSDTIGPRTECSLGREGDQCQCSGTGCDMVSPPTVRVSGAQVALGNNHGTRVVSCQSGLVCAPFLRPSGTISDPRDIEYFCQRPEGLVNRSSSGGTATCSFHCADGSPAGTQLIPNSCNAADVMRTEGSRACLTVCSSVCGGSGGAGCLGLRCVAPTPAP